MKSLAGVAANTRPLARDLFAVRRDCADGRAAGLGHTAESLFDDVGEASAFVAGRGIGAAVGAAAGEVIVIPAHFADQLRGPLREWRRAA